MASDVSITVPNRSDRCLGKLSFSLSPVPRLRTLDLTLSALLGCCRMLQSICHIVARCSYLEYLVVYVPHAAEFIVSAPNKTIDLARSQLLAHPVFLRHSQSFRSGYTAAANSVNIP